MQYSVIVLFFNEAASLSQLYREIVAAMTEVGGKYEIIFVDDGSFDESAQTVEALAAADSRCRTIRFNRTRGKSAAYMAGFEEARGHIVITLDADLQDDPAEIPQLVSALKNGFDLVVGWKKNRFRNEPTKKLPSLAFNALKGLVFGLRLHDSNCGFRAMRRAVAQSLELYGDHYRFLPELAHRQGFRVTEVPVRHRPRIHGHSKYGVTRFWTALLDVLTVRFVTGFIQKPLHFFGTLGLVPGLLGVGLEIYVLVRKLNGSPFQKHVAAIIIGVTLIVLGVYLIGIGLLGEMMRALLRPRQVDGPHRRDNPNDADPPTAPD